MGFDHDVLGFRTLVVTPAPLVAARIGSQPVVVEDIDTLAPKAGAVVAGLLESTVVGKGF